MQNGNTSIDTDIIGLLGLLQQFTLTTQRNLSTGISGTTTSNVGKSKVQQIQWSSFPIQLNQVS